MSANPDCAKNYRSRNGPHAKVVSNDKTRLLDRLSYECNRSSCYYTDSRSKLIDHISKHDSQGDLHFHINIPCLLSTFRFFNLSLNLSPKISRTFLKLSKIQRDKKFSRVQYQRNHVKILNFLVTSHWSASRATLKMSLPLDSTTTIGVVIVKDRFFSIRWSFLLDLMPSPLPSASLNEPSLSLLSPSA